MALPDSVSRDDMAGLLALSTRQIRRLVAEGVLVASGRGLDLRRSVHGYLERLRRRVEDNDTDLRTAKLQAEIVLLKERSERRQAEAMETVRTETWDAMQDALMPLRRALEAVRKRHAPSTPDGKAVWSGINAALKRVADNIRQRGTPRHED